MIRGQFSILVAVVLSFTSPVQAGEIRLYPPSIQLNGQGARHRVLVVEEVNGQTVACRSDQFTLSSSSPDVVAIEENQYVVAKKDGTTQITARSAKGEVIKQTIQVKVTNAATQEPPGFLRDVIPVLTKLGCNTGSCHGAMAGKGGLKLSLRGYDPESDYFAITRQAFQRRLDLHKPEQSMLLLKPLKMIPHGGGQKLDADTPEYQMLVQWIKSGAPEVESQPITLKSIAVYPPQAKLNQNASIPTIVQATYSDGRTVDITRRAKFGSSEDQLMKVADDGQVTVTGSGAGAITVLYANLVAAMPVVSPYPASKTTEQKLTVRNYIDEHINRWLQELQLPASPPATDQEFIRRAYLDAIGTLPTTEELASFLADKEANKRSKLIDTLLARPEYVDYWTNKWADLFLISSKKLPGPNVWAFHQYLRSAVAENLPWNQLATQVLTARGSNLQNGAANYYVMHKDISDLTETTAITFLGTSITCARCHNHPLDKWTQDQYWSMANLLARVGHKAGTRANEVIVQPLQEGEALHLRRQKAMQPAPLDGPGMELASTADRRMHFAKWLISPENPHFAKAIVNRVWRNYMGRGLVESEDDHRPTNPPSHPELLSALEQDFIKNGYDMKRLMKLIMNSASYQRSSQTVPGNEGDEKFYSHYLLRRMKAEVILDAYSQVLSVPTPFTQVESGGRDAITATTEYPSGTKAMQLPDTRIVSRFLAAFGRPEREQVCACERESDATVGQALHVNNGFTLNDKLRAKESRLNYWLDKKLSNEQILDDLYQRAFARLPTKQETKRFLTEMQLAGSDQAQRREILEDLCWALLSSKEFLFNH